MRKARCSNPEERHYYDGDMYDKCPYCGYPEGDDTSDVFVNNVWMNTLQEEPEQTEREPQEKKGLFGLFRKKKAEETVQPAPIFGQQADSEYRSPALQQTVPLRNVREDAVSSEPKYHNECEESNDIDSLDGIPTEKLSGGVSATETSLDSVKPTVKAYAPEPEPKTDAEDTLQFVDIEQAQVSDTGRNSDSEATISLYFDDTETEPVCGWLVGVSKNCLGKVFKILSTKTFIGRDSSMDIVLDNDREVSRDKHAIIIYDSKKRQFILKSGDGRGLTYCNDDLVIDSIVLKKYDLILMGKTQLVFVPLCGEKFSWDDEF